MRTKRQEYKIIVDVLCDSTDRDVSEVIKDVINTGLLPDDFVCLVQVVKFSQDL